ncbi:MAG: DUF5050 domain-containing protein [Bacteroides sp.]|nr:DUF5050 domain-containing protein [Eubacterium sp.]MCM1418727.1 DUF5050 domain-containing protein [Roseburia sp.]MCM1462794.1 DUF5050 domain-containing protein [Bacteroides sp.]
MKRLLSILALCAFMGSAACAKEPNVSDSSPDAPIEAIPDFTGISALEDTTGISSLNNKECTYQPFCCDDEYIYFSNPRDRQFLYSYDGERLTRLTEIPAYDLNYYDNAVYFLSNERTIDPQDRTTVPGYLYRYDLSEKRTDKLSDFLMSSLSVTAEGIFYQNEDENGLMNVYRFDDSEDPDAPDTPLYHSFSIQSYHRYHLSYVPGEERIDFYLSNDEESFRLPIEGLPRHDCIVNGKYYYTPQGVYSLMRLDLATGEQLRISPPDARVLDYTVFQGIEYLLLNGEMASHHNGEIEYLNSDHQYEYIYSGVNALYALKRTYGGGGMEYDLFELTIDGNNVHGKNITSPAA